MYIDLSSNNGNVDFAQLVGKVDEIFIRSSLGYGDVDKMLSSNAKKADAAGIPVSYYHFAYPHSGVDPAADAQKQANYFCDTISGLPKFTNLAIDLENFSATTDTTISKSDYSTWLSNFLNTVEDRLGYRCIIYTYASYLNQHLPSGHAFGSYPLWIANYGNVENPPLPIGWTEYFAWQYTEAGTLPGINGHVDMSKTA